MAKKLKVKVYIDGANMFYAQKKLGWLFDWGKVKKYLKEEYRVEEIRFYSGFKEGKKTDLGFLRKLKNLGFKIISKPLKLIEDEITGKIILKANFDVEITKDILYEVLNFRKQSEVFIFWSGDSDFAPLIWDLKKRFQKKIFVYSSRGTLSWEMRLACSRRFYLEKLKDKIYRKEWGLTKKRSYVISRPSSRRSS